jgi:C4-dicarboxylate transporter DctQ subunit
MKILDHLEEWFVTFLMGGATLIIFFAVLHRYASGLAIPGVQDWLLALDFGWAQELCIIMFVWMAKFGAAYGVRTGIHVGVDVLINRLPPLLRSRFIVFGLLAGATFTGIVGTLGAYFVWNNGLHYALFNALGLDLSALPAGPITPDLEWPTWMVYSAIPLGTSLMCFRFLQVAWNFIHTGKLPHHDHGHVDGLQEGKAHIEANPYSLKDNLHFRDLRDDPDCAEKDKNRQRQAYRREKRGEADEQ